MLTLTEKRFPWKELILIFFGLGLLLLIRNYGIDTFSGVSIYYNEGPLLDQAMRLLHGQSIYRPDIVPPFYTVSNYGPLFHILQLPFLAFYGPTMLYGRLISIVGHLATALLAGLLIRHLTGNLRAGAITALLVLIAPTVGGLMPLYRVDILAQALSMAGIYTALTASPTIKRLAIAGALFSASIYTKQSYGLVGPSAVAGYYLLNRQVKNALCFAVMLVMMMIVSFIGAQEVTQNGFLFNVIISNINEYSALHFLHFLIELTAMSIFSLAALPLLLWKGTPQRQGFFFCILYFLLAAIASLAASKIGSNLGYFSELQVSLACIMGLLVARLDDSSPRKEASIGLLISGQAILSLIVIADSNYHAELFHHATEYAHIEEMIRQTPGPVLADDLMGMVTLTGKPLYFQPFEMNQLQKRGYWSQASLLADLRQRKYSLIVIDDIAGAVGQRWTPEMLSVLAQHYHQENLLWGHLQLWRR